MAADDARSQDIISHGIDMIHLGYFSTRGVKTSSLDKMANISWKRQLNHLFQAYIMA